MEYDIYYEICGALMRPVTACSAMNFIVTAENRSIIQPNNECGRLAGDSPTQLVEAFSTCLDFEQLIIRNCDRNTTCTVQMTGVLPGTWWKQMKANGSRRKHVLVSDKFQCPGYVLMVSKPNKSTIPI